MIYQLYNANDPQAVGLYKRWPFVYLHGKLEENNREKEEIEGWTVNCASDVFLVDGPMPIPGTYLGQFYGSFVLILIDDKHDGRVSLLEDIEGLSHTIRPDYWR
jgi:hypothetical protein